MAITIPLLAGRQADFDPDDARGPFTFQLPSVDAGTPSDNGTFATVNATTYGATPVIIETVGSDQIAGPGVGPTSSLTTLFFGNAIRFTFATHNNQWKVYQGSPLTDEFCFLYGGIDPFAPGSSPTAVRAWGNSAETALFENATDAALGEITLPRDGLYEYSFQIIGQQGSTNKEITLDYWIQQTGLADEFVDSIQISDDKTNRRVGKLVPTPQTKVTGNAGDVVNVAMSWDNGSVGTMTFKDSMFKIRLVNKGLLQASF